MRRIKWSERASFDLEEIADYYSDIDPTLPDTIIRRIEAGARPLLDQPRMGAAQGTTGLRKWRAKRTPYLLLYYVRGDIIYVARVVHAATDWRMIV